VPAVRRNVVIMGAGGRDFHDFNVVFRNDPSSNVVAFTAAQVPGIAGRVYPPALAGALYPAGIPIWDEAELSTLIRRHLVDEVVLSYSDLPHQDVMHRASRVLAAGAGFRLLGPAATMLPASRPVVAVCAVRTGAGKSPTSRRIARLLRDAGLRPVVVRHPAPYGDLEAERVQRFASVGEIDAARPTIEEREELEAPVSLGLVVYTGVDYAAILEQAAVEGDVIVWDGGNNDLPFVRPDLLVTVTDPLRSGQELAYHPGEAALRMADVVVVNKVDSADRAAVERVLADAAAVNPEAKVVRTASPVALEPGPALMNAAVLVVEDGPTVTRGGMPFGAGTVAAQQARVGMRVDPRQYAVGSIAETFERYPHLGAVLPAMGYSDEQLRELEATIDAVECDAVVSAAQVDLARLIRSRHPIRRVSWEIEDAGEPTLAVVLSPVVELGMRSREGR
jgi:predicted GTPase